MAVIVPTSGSASYNGFDFSAAASTQIRVENIFNDGMTTVKYRKYTITISDFINSNTAGADYTVAEALLLAPAGALRYTGRGFGDFTVNTVANDKDINGGPFPQFINWTPLGQDQTVFFVWACETIVSPCAASNIQSEVAAMEYKIENTRHPDLSSEVRYVGYIEIPQFRLAEAVLAHNAEYYKKRFEFDIPSGYVRTSQKWTLNEKRNRIDFEIVDTEMVEQYPENITDADGSFGVASAQGSGDSFLGTMRLNFVVAKGAPKAAAWLAMREMLAVRFLNGERPALFLTFEVTEGLFKSGRKVDFVVVWRINLPLETLLTNSGLFLGSHFQPLSYRRTQSFTRMKTPIFGVTKVNNQDVIIGLCDRQAKQDFLSSDSASDSFGSGGSVTRQEQDRYIGWRTIFSTWKDNNTRINYPTSPSGNETAFGSYSSENGTASVYSSGEPGWGLNMSGAAARVGKPPDAPNVLTIGGKTAIEVGTPVIARSVEEIGGVRVYFARWIKSYITGTKPDSGDVAGETADKTSVPDLKKYHPMLINSGRPTNGGRGGTFSNGTFSGSGATFSTGTYSSTALGNVFRMPTGIYYKWPTDVKKRKG